MSKIGAKWETSEHNRKAKNYRLTLIAKSSF